MANILGLEVGGIPSINVSGWLSNSWFYVLILGLIGFFLVVILVIVLFMMTYNRRIIYFENISGLGYQPVRKKKARLFRVGKSGEEVLKELGGDFRSAYGRKMGKNTYWFIKGDDGYWYNFLMGSFDQKKAMAGINLVDKDVRMFHLAMGEINALNYLKKGFMEKYGTYIVAFIMLGIIILGGWFLLGKVGDASAALSSTAQTNAEVAATNRDVLVSLNNILNEEGGSGLVPALGGG